MHSDASAWIRIHSNTLENFDPKSQKMTRFLFPPRRLPLSRPRWDWWKHFRDDGTILGMMRLFWPLLLALFSHFFHAGGGQAPKGEQKAENKANGNGQNSLIIPKTVPSSLKCFHHPLIWGWWPFSGLIIPNLKSKYVSCCKIRIVKRTRKYKTFCFVVCQTVGIQRFVQNLT